MLTIVTCYLYVHVGILSEVCNIFFSTSPYSEYSFFFLMKTTTDKLAFVKTPSVYFWVNGLSSTPGGLKRAFKWKWDSNVTVGRWVGTKADRYWHRQVFLQVIQGDVNRKFKLVAARLLLCKNVKKKKSTSLTQQHNFIPLVRFHDSESLSKTRLHDVCTCSTFTHFCGHIMAVRYPCVIAFIPHDAHWDIPFLKAHLATFLRVSVQRGR